MKIISLTLLTVYCVLLLNVQAFGHDACQSEKDDLADAKSDRNSAARSLTLTIGAAAAGKYAIDQARKRPPLPDRPYTKAEKATLAILAANVADATANLASAQSKVDRRQRAVDRCVQNDTRNCPGNCSKLHTKSVTSCECNCSPSLSPSQSGCDCGTCSGYLNNN